MWRASRRRFGGGAEVGMLSGGLSRKSDGERRRKSGLRFRPRLDELRVGDPPCKHGELLVFEGDLELAAFDAAFA